jgi:hypothetical protein
MSSESTASGTKWTDAVAQAAANWQDPDYERRAEAVAKTLDAPNRFTEQAVAFAINQQMRLLTPDALRTWIDGRRAPTSRRIAVRHAGTVPLAGFADLLAVLLTGHRYVGVLAEASPYLLPAFVEEIQARAEALPDQFASRDEALEDADGVLASGDEETLTTLAEQARKEGMPDQRCFWRPQRYTVALVDGNESDDEREGLAEDALLHDGRGARSVAVLWAPAGTAPDPYFGAFAQFRGVFPAHDDLPGALQMPQAFLDAADEPHAYAEDLQFLISRGDPEPQQPGHVRWVPYDERQEAVQWIREHEDALEAVVVREGLQDQLPALPEALPVVAPGEAHRPPLSALGGRDDTVAFLTDAARWT